MYRIEKVIQSFTFKLESIFSTVQGFVIALGSLIISFLCDYQVAFIAVFVFILLDLLLGIWSAVKQKKYAKSELIRDTLSKFIIYYGSIIAVAIIAKLFGVNHISCTKILAGLICCTELWSIIGNALIINPKLYLFRLLKPALIGEVAKKMGISEEEVKKIFNDDKEENKKDTQE